MFSQNKKSARLSQWDGRRRSSRGDVPILPRLFQRPVLIRLGVVLVTALATTLLTIWWGPPLPYRVGESYPYELRVRSGFERTGPLSEQAREEAVERLPAEDSLAPHKQHAVPPVVEKYPEGTLIVPVGKPISERQIALLGDEHRAYVASLGTSAAVRRGAAVFLIMTLLATLVVLYVVRFQPALANSLSKTIAVCGLVYGTVLLSLVLSRAPWYAVLVPLTVTTMILTIAYNQQFALLMSFSLALAVTVSLNTGLELLLVQMGGLATTVLLLRNVRTRTRLVEVGLGAGTAFLAMTAATGLLSGQTSHMIIADAGRHFLWGTLAGFIVTGILPLVERTFGIVTDISLLELADGSHPLLQELVRRAPGTYTHSITVATLTEAAAEAIGANPLLTRVGSYFHDIGKMLKPHYFIENQTGENRHDALEPALSTLVIIGHVKDGLALARQYNLPRPIVDFIAQHHGTTLVEYFYREAMRLQELSQNGPVELESTFRYPGPKPQTRETGIVMLADAVESSSRALNGPTPGSVRKLVHDLLMKRLLDGQFDESGLTLTELHLIEESLSKSLIALYHSRIKYPELKLRGA